MTGELYCPVHRALFLESEGCLPCEKGEPAWTPEEEVSQFRHPEPEPEQEQEVEPQLELEDLTAGVAPRLETPAREIVPRTRLMAENSLWELLKYGEHQVTSGHDIATQLGINQRAVGSLVNDLRMAGRLVGSVHGKGYYRIETSAELEQTIEHIVKRISGIRATEKALRDAWESR